MGSFFTAEIIPDYLPLNTFDSMVYNGSMVGSILRSWTGRVVILVVLAVIGYSVLVTDSGPPAIRPAEGQVDDPILLPVIENYADEVDANRGDPKIRMHLGMTYEAATLNTLAEATYLQFVKLFPKRAIGWYRLAVVQERQGNLDDAIFSIQRAAEVSGDQMAAPHWQLALWLIDVGRIEEAKNEAKLASSIKPNSLPVQIANARIAIVEGNPEIAIELLNKEDLISEIQDGYVYQLLGRAYRANGEEEKSRLAWSRAGQSKPKWGDPWTANVVSHVVGLQLMRQQIKQAMRSGELGSARKLIQEYFTYEPDNVLVRRFDAICDVRQGSVSKGLRKLATLIKEDPNDTSSMMLLAKSRLNIPQLRNEEGLEVTKEILETVLAIDTENDNAKVLLGDIADMLTPKDEE